MILITRILAASMILVHATLGCCAHETLLGDEDCNHGTCITHGSHDHSLTATAGIGSDSLLKNEEVGQDCNHEHQHPVPHECRHTNCKWSAPVSRDQVELILLSFAKNIQRTLSISQVLLLADGSDTHLLWPCFSQCSSSLRTHLAKCVLLL